MVESSSNSEKLVLVCQFRTCLKDGAAKVLAALQAEEIAGVTVAGCGCLGLCGSGPMVLVSPDEVYYWRVSPEEVPIIVKKHLRGGKPVITMLHPRLHPHPEDFL